jgi:magnesium chelatase subunit H
VETFGEDVAPRDLDETLRLEYRSKLLNPRWAEAMADQGSGGAFEISQRMTALIGWGATSGFQENWVYDGAHERFVADEAMREKLRRANPQAFRNVLKRMLEAAGRGMWDADEDVLDELRALYSETEDELEGVRTRP